MARLLGHRQTKETATDKPNLPLPRHIPTLPIAPLRFLDQLTFDQLLCRVASSIFGSLLWRSLATLARSGYVCCALRPVIPDPSALRHEWLELAVLRRSSASPY
jgi:hypothetical protein